MAPLELGWALCDRLYALFAAPLDPLFASVEGMTDADAILAATDPETFRHGCAKGLDAVVGEGSNPSWPPAVRAALTDLAREVGPLLSRFDPTARLVKSAADRVRQLHLPSGWWAGFFKGAGEAATPGTAANLGAVGGATLGTFLLPGVGTGVGGALGAYLGGLQGDSRRKATIEEYDRAFGHVLPALKEVFAATWDRVVDRVERHGGISLPTSVRLGQAEGVWENLLARIEETESWCVEAGAFVDRHGPHLQALRGLILVRVARGGDRASEVDGWLATLLRLYPGRVESAECEAAVLFEKGDYAEAADVAVRGLAKAPGHATLRAARAEALAAAGRGREVDPERWIGTDGEAWRAYARGACRASDLGQAAAAVQGWKATGVDVQTIADALRADQTIMPCFTALAARVQWIAPAEPAPPQPIRVDADSVRLRNELMGNPNNAALRRRYLAARTSEQQRQDAESVPRWHHKLYEPGIALAVGLVVASWGFIGAMTAICIAISLVANAWERVRSEKLRGIARAFGPLPNKVPVDEAEARRHLLG